MKQAKTPRSALQGSKILIVDDEEMLAWSIETELKSNGVDALTCGNLRSALESFQGFNPDLVITDLRLPDGSGMELLKRWRHERPDMPVILITAHGAVESAIDALRLGAFDYLQKPFDMKALVATVGRAAEMSYLRQKLKQMTGRESPRGELTIVGESATMKRTKDQLHRVAQSKANNVLITGESGTGKELAARAVHDWSHRSDMPFIEINCASIPENLLESELFGYEKGAFTDARERKLGLFEIAQQGTIFLDEIGEMPLKLQAKLLRALESRRFTRLGGTKEVSFAARIVAATNRKLLREAEEGRFRADLYYRLSALPIHLPPLRDRMEDLESLISFFVAKICKDLEIDEPTVASDVRSKLSHHSWPGNLRELSNVIQRALVFYNPKVLTSDMVEIDELGPVLATESGSVLVSKGQGPAIEGASRPKGFFLPPEGIDLEKVERELIMQALRQAQNNQTRAAELLGITRHTLRYRLEKHGIAGSC
jgi:two-component system response regulator AtoC